MSMKAPKKLTKADLIAKGIALLVIVLSILYFATRIAGA